MPELDRIHCRVLKYINKHPQGISTETLEKKFNKKIGLTYILNNLLEQEYLSRLTSREDTLRHSMGLESVGNTGDWIVSDKGLAYLKNKKVKILYDLIKRLEGFAAGIIATILSELIIWYVISQIK